MRVKGAEADLGNYVAQAPATLRSSERNRSLMLVCLRPMDLGVPLHFDEGFAIDPKLAAKISPSLIGRQLSGDDAG